MKEALDEIWQCIRYHKNGCDDETLTVVVALHIVAGLIGAIILAALTPIGGWVVIGAGLAIVFGIIWQFCPDGDLAVGYFVAFHISSMAWVGVLPIALFIGLFTFPIIIHEYKKAHPKPQQERPLLYRSQQEREEHIFMESDETIEVSNKGKKRKKK
jgi:hypothetical protein